MKLFATALLVGLLLLIPATTALAGQGDVIRDGSCSGRSDWKLKLSPQDGRIEVEFEVDQNVVGVAGGSGSATTATSCSAPRAPPAARAGPSRPERSNPIMRGLTRAELELGTCRPARGASDGRPSDGARALARGSRSGPVVPPGRVQCPGYHGPRS